MTARRYISVPDGGTDLSLAEERGYEDVPYECDNCALPIEEDDAAPSCGSHWLHIGCHEWFRCRHCTDVLREIAAENDAAWLT